MNILCTDTFENQLKTLLEEFVDEDLSACKNFKMYLDTIILNMPTKVQKFKKSIYFDDDNIKDIEHQGLIIPFYIDEDNENYLILGIVKK
ncbi:hypothetical protein [Sulfurimonas paralvinellae]|uniref:Uncharacterized protein n=1 Tax=Sulfurimonas paralvinellae TaxID=317658 RepID=A0A7M1BAC3_9BACT|nr:hypothetical protein [Sulfurimonas paralvinellae]QOP46605.1 hypothetical protein FM071_10005 [Sulfurimonas paralvinellae]